MAWIETDRDGRRWKWQRWKLLRVKNLTLSLIGNSRRDGGANAWKQRKQRGTLKCIRLDANGMNRYRWKMNRE